MWYGSGNGDRSAYYKTALGWLVDLLQLGKGCGKSFPKAHAKPMKSSQVPKKGVKERDPLLTPVSQLHSGSRCEYPMWEYLLSGIRLSMASWKFHHAARHHGNVLTPLFLQADKVIRGQGIEVISHSTHNLDAYQLRRHWQAITSELSSVQHIVLTKHCTHGRCSWNQSHR